MLKTDRKINNPINIIAVFALITETSAAVSLPFLDNEDRKIYIWLLISFPFFLSFLFFITLNFNYRSLYAPSDFENDDSFLKAFEETASHLHETATQPDIELHTVKLQKSFTTLYIVDIRGRSVEFDTDALLKKIPPSSKHSLRIFLFLTRSISDVSLTENVLKSFKQAKKAAGTTYCIAYDVDSMSMIQVEKV
ncbi:UNVERIFIED_ORG: hypothetical protein J2X80_002638 [Pseudomonas fluorescens]|jgi:hypothetical protein|uniref:hypothetical protein n=1 Tax=Pseudomonas TaxID=286 RepID=UPI000A1E3AE4|nr:MULTISPECIES: hypothetical protein [unclassified Pseudomonas]MDP9710555.1 hypothetical protein [Pseudomonas fluorescens]